MGELGQLDVDHELIVAPQKSRCPYTCGQLWAALRSFARVAGWAKGRGEVLGVTWRCWCGFPTEGKGARGLAWEGRGHGRNIVTGEGFCRILEILEVYKQRRGQKGELHMAGRN